MWADVPLLPGTARPVATLGRTAGDWTLQVAIMYVAEKKHERVQLSYVRVMFSKKSNANYP